MKISAEVRAAMAEIARAYGRQGGKASAKNLTPEERSARAKKASTGGSQEADGGAARRERAARKK